MLHTCERCGAVTIDVPCDCKPEPERVERLKLFEPPAEQMEGQEFMQLD